MLAECIGCNVAVGCNLDTFRYIVKNWVFRVDSCMILINILIII